MTPRAALLVPAALLLAACEAPPPQGDAARGEVQHMSCLQCHETDVYLPPKRRVQSLDELRRETARWGDMYNPAFTPQAVEDVVAYLNRDFYRFPAEGAPKR